MTIGKAVGTVLGVVAVVSILRRTKIGTRRRKGRRPRNLTDLL